MKVLFIKKKNIIYFALIILTLLICYPLFIHFKTTQTTETFTPIDNSKITSIDLTGDGIDDTLKVINKNNNIDIQITSNNRNYSLSTLCEDNILLSSTSSWPIKVFIRNLSRNKVPEIIIQGTKNKTPLQYIFRWDNGNFIKGFSSNKNIFGILDFNNNKTPQCYSLNSSSGISSVESFMFIDREYLNITNDSKPIPDIINIIQLIDIIQKDYEVQEVPNIFKEGISEAELGLLWNLDKEFNVYSFQDGFFYDDSIDNEGNITSLKWRLTFEKYIKDKDDSSKSEVVFYITTERTSDMSYKISSLYMN
ncbi:hypothetical protein ACQPU1_13760 [Clostridium paraputrificum]|uniref:hypothetical protein n=1 Tax=Clostridium TaxID=1485 RepID=UPI003D341843